MRSTTLYHVGDDFGTFHGENFTSNDLDLILEMDLEQTKEIDLAFEKLQLEGGDL